MYEAVRIFVRSGWNRAREGKNRTRKGGRGGRGMRNNSAGIRGTRARGRKQSKRSHGYSDLSAATSGNGSVDKLRGTTISRLKGRPQRGKREVQTFLSSHNPIRNHSVDRENNCVIHDYACRCSCNSPPVLGKSSITMYIDDDNVDQRAYS